MTNIKYSKRFKLRNGERVDFCPECDYHITDTVNNSDSVYCPKCGQPEIGDVYFYVAVDEGKNKGVIHSETLFNKNDIKFLLLKKAGKYYKSYFEAEKHLKEDYEYLTGE